MSLTAPRNTPQLGCDPILNSLKVPVAAATKIYQGAFVFLDASGNAVPGGSTGVLALGRAEETVDNTTGSAGALEVKVSAGIFKWANSASTDLIADADVGHQAFIVDDQTVAKTSAGARAPAGTIVKVADGGVYVLTQLRQPKAPIVIGIPYNLADIANGDILTDYTPGFAGRIKKIAFAVTKPATTAAKLATLNMEIGSTNLTGGVVALTSANCTPIGAVIAGSAITAANRFSATDTISIEASSVTAFVEGAGMVLITVEPE
jgi:hypothetical protein